MTGYNGKDKKPCLGVCLGGVFLGRVGLLWGCGGVLGSCLGTCLGWGFPDDLGAALSFSGRLRSDGDCFGVG